MKQVTIAIVITVTLMFFMSGMIEPQIHIPTSSNVQMGYENAWVGVWKVEYIDGMDLGTWANNALRISSDSIQSWTFTFRPDRTWSSIICLNFAEGKERYVATITATGEFTIQRKQYTLGATSMGSSRGTYGESKRIGDIIENYLTDNQEGDWFSKLNNNDLGLRAFGGFTVTQE